MTELVGFSIASCDDYEDDCDTCDDEEDVCDSDSDFAGYDRHESMTLYERNPSASKGYW